MEDNSPQVRIIYTVKWDLLPVIFLLLSVKCVLKYFSDNIMLKEAGQIVYTTLYKVV